MFKHLGIFAVLAVCLFAIVIVMGGCNGGDNGGVDKPIDPPDDSKEKTFKEQLTEGSWRMVSNADGVLINAAAQEMAEGFAQIVGFAGAIKGTVTENRLRFDANSGKASWNFALKMFPPDDPEDSFELVYALKGPYFISEESGSSATMTFSITEADAKAKGGGEEFDIPGDFAEEAGIFGDFFADERASINGDQLRIGQMLLERN